MGRIQLQTICFAPAGSTAPILPANAAAASYAANLEIQAWYLAQLGVTFDVLASVSYTGSETWAQIKTRYGGTDEGLSANGADMWERAVADCIAAGLNICDPNKMWQILYFHPPVVSPPSENGCPVGMSGTLGVENFGCSYSRPGMSCIGDRMMYLLCGYSEAEIVAMGWSGLETNLYTNPGFEADVNAVEIHADTTKAQDATEFKYGTKSLKWESTLNLTVGKYCNFTTQAGDYIPVTAGERYTLSLWLKPIAGASAATYHVGMRWLDSGGALISHSWGLEFTFPRAFALFGDEDWTPYWCSAEAPVGAVTAKINVEENLSMYIGDGVHIDGVMFVQGLDIGNWPDSANYPKGALAHEIRHMLTNWSTDDDAPNVTDIGFEWSSWGTDPALVIANDEKIALRNAGPHDPEQHVPMRYLS